MVNNMEKIDFKEFLLGMAIIVFCCTIWTMIKPPIIETTLVVRIEPIYDIKTKTDNEGNVTVYVYK